MDDGLKIVLWLAIIAGSIASSMIKAAKKRAEKDAADLNSGDYQDVTGYEPDRDSGRFLTSTPSRRPMSSTTPARGPMSSTPTTPKSFRHAIENIAREAREAMQEQSTSEAWPAFEPVAGSTDARAVAGRSGSGAARSGSARAVSEPAATSYDYRSLEETEDELAVYERLTAEREQRTTIASAGSSSLAAKTLRGAKAAAAVPTSAADENSHDTMDFNFDLRRAVIDAEILTPKWL